MSSFNHLQHRAYISNLSLASSQHSHSNASIVKRSLPYLVLVRISTHDMIIVVNRRIYCFLVLGSSVEGRNDHCMALSHHHMLCWLTIGQVILTLFVYHYKLLGIAIQSYSILNISFQSYKHRLGHVAITLNIGFSTQNPSWSHWWSILGTSSPHPIGCGRVVGSLESVS